jgi:RNA polymerase sigma-70 factor (ECF subfamily)
MQILVPHPRIFRYCNPFAMCCVQHGEYRMDALVSHIAPPFTAGLRMSMDTHAARSGPPLVSADLIDRCRRGQMSAFEDVYNTYKSYLFSLAWRFHGNRADAEDSLQEAFAAAFRSIGSFEGNAKFSTWLYRILLNTCISRKRKTRTEEEQSDFLHETRHPSASDPSGDVMLARLLETQLRSLPELQRAVFLLYASEGFTHEEIGETLRISSGTSKSYYHRAKETLRKRLRAAGIDEREAYAS